MPSTGTPASKIAIGASGAPGSCTEAGPPERITALRLHLAKAASAFWNGTISRIDALLAHAPRDQLRHLRAEIDDEDFVVHEAPF